MIVKVFDEIKAAKPAADIRKGQTIVCRGEIEYDRYINEIVLRARSIGSIKKVQVVDNAPEKRVELHLHTKMSAMDGVSDASSLIKQAYDWGHPAVAITDHGVAQAFPEAMDTVESLVDREDEDNPDAFKVIYGTEAYFVNDMISAVSGKADCELSSSTIVCFDLETTGLSASKEAITEIGAVKIENGCITETFSTFVNPKRPIPQKIIELTGITDAMVKTPRLKMKR